MPFFRHIMRVLNPTKHNETIESEVKNMRLEVKYPLQAERLNYAMKLRGIKAVKLCALTGLDKATISNYRHGYFRPTEKDRLNTIAKALHVAPEWLDGYDVPMEKYESNLTPLHSSAMRNINQLEYISCGCGTFNEGSIVGVLSLPAEMFKPSSEYFAITAQGDSMINAGIEDGDILIFEVTNIPLENKIGAFCLENEYAICKKYKSTDGQIFLLSANDNYAPILIDPMDECFRCVGILVNVIKQVR